MQGLPASFAGHAFQRMLVMGVPENDAEMLELVPLTQS
jgi:hypothetical protein